MAQTHKAGEFVEIYQAESQIAAQKIVDVLLGPEGIEVMLHDRLNVVAPAPAGQAGGFFIAVPADQRERAVTILEEAKDNGYLDDEDGELISTPPR